MENFSEADKLTLEGLVEGGAQVATVAYDPTTVVGDPEATALGDGWVEYYREDTANLIEVIYTQ